MYRQSLSSLSGSSALANISRHEVAAYKEKPEVLANWPYSPSLLTDYRSLKLIVNMAWNIDIANVSFVALAEIMSHCSTGVYICL